MASTLVELADAVAAALAEVPELDGATIARTYVPRLKLESMGEALFCNVVLAAAINSARTDRLGSYRRDPIIDIGLHKRVANDAAADDFVELLDRVCDHLWRERVEGRAAISVDIRELYVPEHLSGEGVFTGVIRVTYREGRSLA